MAKFCGLGFGPLQGDGHVPQRAQARLRVQVIAPIPRQTPRGQLEHGEGEDVRGPVHLAGGQVYGVNPPVIGQKHIDFTGDRHLFFLQGGQNALTDHPGYRNRQKAPVVK